MLRVSLFAILGFFTLMPMSPAQADWHSFWNRTHLDWHRNNCWPAPFQKADRETVCQTMSVQIANGWQRQNTLSSVYFDEESQQLNDAGRRRLWAIMTQSPEQYRTIYIVRSMSKEAQDRRIDSVQQSATELFDNEPLPEVVSVNIEPRAWDADYIYSVHSKERASMPNPRLPEFSDTTGGN